MISKDSKVLFSEETTLENAPLFRRFPGFIFQGENYLSKCFYSEDSKVSPKVLFGVLHRECNSSRTRFKNGSRPVLEPQFDVHEFSV